MSKPASSPPADDFSDQLRAAQAEITAGIERAGLLRDPYGHALAALATVVGVLSGFSRHWDEALGRARQPIDAEDLKRLEHAAASGADRRAAILARTHNRRTLLLAASGLVGAIVVSFAGGFVFGSAAHRSAIASTAAGLTAAFAHGDKGAAAWLALMRANDPAQALARCTGEAVHAIAGRRACAAPLWLDPPKNAAPGVGK